MARPETLIPGNCYFLVNYYDNDLLFPHVHTLRYLRREEDDAESGRVWLFEEPSAPVEGESQSVDQVLFGFSDDELYQILDFPDLIAALREVAVDHPLHKADSPTSLLVPPSTGLTDLPSYVARFIENPEYLALTITVLFTDSGCSVGRRADGGFEMSFYPQIRRQPDREAKIRRLFAGLGIEPHTDYLSNNGRTRVLGFPVPDQHGAIVKLCERVFIEVHGMRAGDSLKYSFLSRSDIK